MKQNQLMYGMLLSTLLVIMMVYGIKTDKRVLKILGFVLATLILILNTVSIYLNFSK